MLEKFKTTLITQEALISLQNSLQSSFLNPRHKNGVGNQNHKKKKSEQNTILVHIEEVF